jgi:hypothetical protein
MLMRCTGGTDAWTDPLDDPDGARCERIVAWFTAVTTTILALTVVGAVVVEGYRAWA